MAMLAVAEGAICGKKRTEPEIRVSMERVQRESLWQRSLEIGSSNNPVKEQ
jgi:hypothetical protein